MGNGNASRIYNGRAQIDIVIASLLEASCWFEVTPLPSDLWEVAVKRDAERHLPENRALPQPPVLSVEELLALGYEIRADEAPPFRFYWVRDGARSNGNYLDAVTAQSDAVDDALETYSVSRCNDCGKAHTDETMVEVKNLPMRVSGGDPTPSGECPDCGALCYPLREVVASS